MTKEEYDNRIKKDEVSKYETEYKNVLREFAIHYVALWNACHSLGLNDRQTKGMIEFLLNSDNKENDEK